MMKLTRQARPHPPSAPTLSSAGEPFPTVQLFIIGELHLQQAFEE